MIDGMKAFAISIFGDDGAVDRKLKEENLTFHSNADNPLYEEPPNPLEKENMKHMRQDAAMRSCPVNGKVYQGFKSLQYKYSPED